MAGFDNDVLYCDNVDFTGGSPVEGKVISNGQLLIGSTVAPHIRVGSLASSGGSVTITNGPGTINLEAGSAVPTTFTTDSGAATPTDNNINISGGTGIDTTGVGDTLTITFDVTEVPSLATSYPCDNGTATPAANALTVSGQLAGTVPVMFTTGSGSTIDVEDRTWTTSIVVDPSATVGLRGTYQTIQAAINDAVAGQNVFIRPGTYTENLTLKVGVNLISYLGDAFTPQVTIVGTCTLTTAGTVTISGIRLQTNSNFAIAVTGSVASVLNLVNCYLNCTNNTGISFTSSSASSQINLIMCNGDVGTTLIKLYEVTGAGSLFFDRSYISNSGSTLTASTSSSGNVFWQYTYSEVPMTTSATSTMTGTFSYFSTFATNQLILTQGGTSTNLFRHCSFKSGTAIPITISSGLNLQACQIETSNADVISGAGTLTYNALHVNNTTASWTMSVTTQVARYLGQITLTKAFGTNYTASAGDYTVLRSDCIIGITSTAAARTVTMPASGMEIGQMWIIKDESGACATNNITVSGNGANIDGSASYVININYGSISLYWDGSAFNVF